MAMTAIEYNRLQAHNHEALRYLHLWPFSNAPTSDAGVQEIEDWQAEKKIGVDGKLGPAGWAMLRSSADSPFWNLPTIPHGLAGIRAIYGDPKERDGVGGRLIVSQQWEDEYIRKFTLHTGQKVRLNKQVGPEFVRIFEAACTLSGYTPKSVQTYVPRHQNWDPRQPPSRHTFGCAVDFDPNRNGRVHTGTMMHRYPLFPAIFRVMGWRCGVDWRGSSVDPMHVERSGM